MIRASDFVIAGNEFLRSQVFPFNPNVEVIPTSIDHERYHLKDYSIRKEKVTLRMDWRSWIHPLLGEDASHFREDRGRYPHSELKIVCDIFFNSEKINVVKKMWNSEEEVADLQSFDIGFMPLVDDPWSWGKCGLKIIQYQGVGVPVVCTPVGINRDLVEDGVNGLWAKTPEEWEGRISNLIEDSLLREKMGKEGRRRVLEKYTVQSCAPRLFSILNRVLEKNG